MTVLHPECIVSMTDVVYRDGKVGSCYVLCAPLEGGEIIGYALTVKRASELQRDFRTHGRFARSLLRAGLPDAGRTAMIPNDTEIPCAGGSRTPFPVLPWLLAAIDHHFLLAPEHPKLMVYTASVAQCMYGLPEVMDN